MPISVVPSDSSSLITAPAYVDANGLVAARFRSHEQYQCAGDVLLQAQERQVELLISALTLDEVWWGLLISWYAVDNGGRKLDKKKVRRRPEIIDEYCSRLRYATNAIMRLPNVVFVPHEHVDRVSRRALSALCNFQLCPRDSFHLAFAGSAGAQSFLTFDSDFARLDGARGMTLTVHHLG